MAIYQRDREFHRLISEIAVDVVPLRFVRDITCVLGDGTKVVINECDFADEADRGEHIEQLLRNLSFYEDLCDLQIRINYDKVEENVVIDVER
jgi:hypothetical protein